MRERQGLALNILVLFLLAPVTFYYLKKLGKWSLYSVLPWVSIYFLIISAIAVSRDTVLLNDSIYYQLFIISGFVITNIALTVKWTRDWNYEVDHPKQAEHKEISHISLLQERYVKGEITKKEYDQIRQDIS